MAALGKEKDFLTPQMDCSASLKTFRDQVGGHGKLLSMNEDSSLIIKPCSGIEREFYENSVLYPGFSKWMPKYYGNLRLHGFQSIDQVKVDHDMISNCDINPQAIKANFTTLNANVKGSEEAICIENVLSKFKKPCVMDVKLGTQLWGEDADERKRLKMIRKAERTTSGSMGIRITAARIYQKSSNNYTNCSRQYCLNLNSNTIITCFTNFFMAELSLSQRQLVIDRFIKDLTSFSEALESHDIRLFGASLLFIYEGDPDALIEALNKEEEDALNVQKLDELSSDDDYIEDEDANYDSDLNDNDDEDEDEEEEEEEDEFKVTELKIIDFAHSFFRDGVGKDEGCLLGVKNAIRCLKQVLNEMTN